MTTETLHTETTSEKPVAPPAPRPAAGKSRAERPDKMRRRIVQSLVFGYLGINFLMFLRFFFPRALFEPNTVVNLGFPTDFKLGVNQQFLSSNRIWVVREPDRIFVILAV